MCFSGDVSPQLFRYPDVGKVSDSNMMHVHQGIVIEHFEITFVTSKTPDDRSICPVDLGDTAEMKPVDDVVALEILLHAVEMTGAGQPSST